MRAWPFAAVQLSELPAGKGDPLNGEFVRSQCVQHSELQPGGGDPSTGNSFDQNAALRTRSRTHAPRNQIRTHGMYRARLRVLAILQLYILCIFLLVYVWKWTRHHNPFGEPTAAMMIVLSDPTAAGEMASEPRSLDSSSGLALALEQPASSAFTGPFLLLLQPFLPCLFPFLLVLLFLAALAGFLPLGVF